MARRVSSPVFVGRREELERLEAALVQVSAEGSRTVLLGGDAGIGKTRLLAEFTVRARAQSAHVLVGGCLQLGSSALPFAPFSEAFRTLIHGLGPEEAERVIGPARADLARLLPELATETPASSAANEDAETARARLFERILGVFERLSADDPVVLALEDLHWADPSSLDLLRFIVRNAQELRLLLLGTFRTDELHRRHPLRPFLAELGRLERVERIDLAPFDRDELLAQLTAIRGEVPQGSLVETLLERSEGNPFYAEELLTALGPAGGLGGLPDSLREAMLVRLSGLSGPAAEVVGAAAVIGQRFAEATLAAVLQRPEAIVTDALREATAMNVLAPSPLEDGDGYVFRHALLREVAYDDLLPSQRTRLHLRAAEVMAESPDRLRRPAEWAAARAYHLYAGRDLERALPAAIEAGLAAEAALAFAEALVQFERALELWPRAEAAGGSLPLDRIILLEHAAEAAMNSGAPTRGVALLREAIGKVDPISDARRAGDLHHRLGSGLVEAGNAPAGFEAWEAALRLIPSEPPSLERASVLADHGRFLAVAGRTKEAEPLLEGALAQARALRLVGVDVLAIECYAIDGLGTCHLWRGDLLRALEVFRCARLEALEAGLPGAIQGLTMAESDTLVCLARFDEAIAVALAARERLRALGLEVRYGLNAMWHVAWSELCMGRWILLERTIATTLALDPGPHVRAHMLDVRSILRARQGRAEDARQDLEECLSLAAAGAVQPRPSAEHEITDAEDAEIAVALLERRWTAVRAILARLVAADPFPDTAPDYTSAYLAGLQAEAEEAIEGRRRHDAERVACAVEVAQGYAARMRTHPRRRGGVPGGCEPADQGRCSPGRRPSSPASEGRASTALWAHAAELREAIGMPYELAYIRLRQAEAMLKSGGARSEAAAHLRQAHDITCRTRCGTRAPGDRGAGTAGPHRPGEDTGSEGRDRRPARRLLRPLHPRA